MTDTPPRRRFWQIPPLRIVIFWIAILGGVAVIQFASRGAGISKVPIGNALTLLLAASTALAVYLTLVPRLEQRVPTELQPAGALGELLAGILLAAVLMSMVIGVLWMTGNVRLAWSGQLSGVLTVGLAAGVSSAIIEELLMRAVMFRIMEEWLGSGVALAVSAVLFGSLHGFNPGATVISCVAIAIEAGILLAAAYMYTRRLWLAIGIHFGWNFVEGSVYGASVSGGKLPSLFASQFSGHELLTGGKFGPEASVVAMVVCTAAGLWLLQRTRKRRSTTSPQVSRSQ